MNPSGPDRNNPPDAAALDADRPTRADGASEESERWLRVAVENCSDMVMIFEADATIRYASPAVERVLGYRPEDLVGAIELDLVHPEDLEHTSKSFAEAVEKPGVQPPIEYRVRAADGSWRRMEAILSNWLDDQNVAGLVANVRDVTERKEAEERYRTLVEQIPGVIYINPSDGSNLTPYISPQIEAMLGYTPKEWMATDLWAERIHPDDVPWVLAANDRSRESGEPFAEEYRLLGKDGSVMWVRDEATLLRDEAGEPLFWQGVMVDFTERKRAEERLHHLAFHDLLTDLPNRQLFADRLGQALRRTRRQRNRVAVLFMDLDEFKVVNDSLGHEAGDLLLTIVAQRLGRCLRPEDTLARFGGDEFVVLIEAVDDPAEAVRVAERITEELRWPFIVEGRELYVAASIGVALGDARTHDPDGLLREADTAMYRAKAEGGGFRVFDPTMYERALGRLEAENDLRRAIEQGEFVVHFQPIVDLRTGEPWGMEALVRWEHPERGLLDPSEFVPVAEESGLVVPMGERVLKEACERAKDWQERHPHVPPLVMAVNVSATQLQRPDLARTVEAVLRETGLEAGSLSLDITETGYIKALEGNTAALDELKRLGVRISIDDFGVGYSSLSYLKRLPADTLKIDKSFVRGLGEDEKSTVIIQMIADLARTLGMEIVAEGVESEGQAERLREMGCDLAQGYHFAEPLPREAVSEFLAR